MKSFLRENIWKMAAAAALILSLASLLCGVPVPTEGEGYLPIWGEGGGITAQASQKLTEMTELTSPASEDLLYAVDDPSGSPLSRKATIANVGEGFANVEATGTISAAGSYYGADYFRHDGDADTYLGFDTADNLTLQAGGTEYVDAGGGAINVNLGGAAGDDFMVDTDTLVVESDNDRVGIGTTGPDMKLTVVGDANIGNGNGLVVGHTAQTSVGGITPETQILGVDSNKTDSTLLIGNYYWAALTMPQLMFVRGRDNSVGNASNHLGAGYKLGEITWYGSDGNDFNSLSARILVGRDDYWGTDDVPSYMAFETAADGAASPTERMRIDSNGNVGIGTSDQFGGGSGVIGIHDAGTNPSSNPTNGVVLYSTGGELEVRDSGGITTTLSPHPNALNGRLGYQSCNGLTGECVLIDIERLAQDLEGVTGGDYITYTYMSEDAIVSWYETQQEYAEQENARRLAEAAGVLTPTLRVDAVEAYSETVEVETGEVITEVITTYELDVETGDVIATDEVQSTPVMTDVATGETLYRLKDGCELEAETGQFLCPVGEADAVYEPYEPQPMPDWMQARFETLILAPKDLTGIERPAGGEYRKLVDIGTEGALWVAKSHEAEALLSVHSQLWALDPAGTFGLLAAVKESGKSFYDKRVRIAAEMTVEEALARRDRIADYLDSLGKNTTALRAATTEYEQVIALVEALGFSESQLWAAME